MTTKEAYETIREYFSRPGAVLAAVGDGGIGRHCVYRTPEGNKCAVGVLIPDELYKPKMERCTLYGGHLLESFPELKEILNGEDAEGRRKLAFLKEAQGAHDSSVDVRDFITELDRLATSMGLIS